MLGRSSKTIILCTLCTMVKALTFDWLEFHPNIGEKETLADFTGVKIKSLEANGTQVNYVYGPFEYKEVFNETQKVHYILRYKNKESQNYGSLSGYPDRTVNSCEFFDQFYRDNMLPMTEKHNDFPPHMPTVCPIKARTYNIWQADNLQQLDAPSKLSPNEYHIEVIFRKGSNIIGGFGGHFIAKDL